MSAEDVSSLEAALVARIAATANEQEARREQAALLKNLSGQLKQAVGELSDKKQFGVHFNRLKNAIVEAVDARLKAIANAALEADLARVVDVTLPGRGSGLGTLHPLTLARREIEQIFVQLGYEVAAGPHAETDFYNFEALNLPKDHPARDMQDTFYLVGPDPMAILLRTHTSPVQIRTMLAQRPPVKIVAPGVVFRRDDDPTHSPQFAQIEGLLVDRVGRVSMADLKGTLLHFVRRYLGPDLGIRLRASFFPFTEPSAEIDMSCVFCRGSGCRLCKGTGFLEIGGCGMVDPEVFRAVGYDAEEVAGFAFGMGIDRMAMLKYRIDDIKTLYEGDVRVLRQFS